MSYTDHSVQRRFKSNAPTDWISQHCLVITWPSKRICSRELVRAAVWTVIRADKRSVWRDSNESRGFVPLLAHKHYIEKISNFLYRFRGKLYRDNYRYRIIAQPYMNVTALKTKYKTTWQLQNPLSEGIHSYTATQSLNGARHILTTNSTFLSHFYNYLHFSGCMKSVALQFKQVSCPSNHRCISAL